MFAFVLYLFVILKLWIILFSSFNLYTYFDLKFNRIHSIILPCWMYISVLVILFLLL